jgi:hypothetical protein
LFARSKYGGDCAAIELYVLCAPLRIATAKLVKNMQSRYIKDVKMIKAVQNNTIFWQSRQLCVPSQRQNETLDVIDIQKEI